MVWAERANDRAAHCVSVACSPRVFDHGNLTGATENARPENAGRSKMQGWKMRDLKIRHQYAGVENAGPENAGPSSIWKAIWRLSVQTVTVMLCQPDISFSALSTVITNRTQPICLKIMYDVW